MIYEYELVGDYEIIKKDGKTIMRSVTKPVPIGRADTTTPPAPNPDLTTLSMAEVIYLGPQTMDTITETSGTLKHDCYQVNIPVTVSANNTLSVFIRAGTRRYLIFYGFYGDWVSIVIDTQTMTILSNAASGFTYVSSSIVDQSNGVYRVSLTYTNLLSSIVYFGLGGTDSTTAADPNTITSSGSGTIIAWGAQVNSGALADYEQTTSATGTVNKLLWSEQLDNAVWGQDGTTITANTDYAIGGAGGYSYKLPGIFGTTPDNSGATTASTLRLFENNVEIGPAHSAESDIITIGAGRFRHWSDLDGANEHLLFSASNNTDPRSNGKTYGYSITAQVGPVISLINVANISTTSVTISWSLSKPATGQIEYGTTQSLGSFTVKETSFNYTAHSQTITGLTPSTLYYFRITSVDSSGNVAVSSLNTFTPTLTTFPSSSNITAFPVTDTTATITWTTNVSGENIIEYGTTTAYGSQVVIDASAIISNVVAQSISSSSVTISWDLSEFATGQVEYGQTTAYGSFTTKETSFDYNHHDQTLTGLTPNTTYHFRIIADDPSGNISYSDDFNFTTIA
jgi:hypothetical protein